MARSFTPTTASLAARATRSRVRRVSEPYRSREHDHLVEPMFAGLGVQEPKDGARGRRCLWLGVAAAFVAVAVRLWMLLARE
jgi:hypothetical protein